MRTNATQPLSGDSGLARSSCSRQEKKVLGSQETESAVWKLGGFSGHTAWAAAPGCVWGDTRHKAAGAVFGEGETNARR